MAKNKQAKNSTARLTPVRSGHPGGLAVNGGGPLQPLYDRVVVQVGGREEQTAGGIYIPETAREEKPEQGTVIAVGPGKLLENGKHAPMAVAVGDKVIFSKYGPDEVEVEGEKYLVVREESILAVVK